MAPYFGRVHWMILTIVANSAKGRLQTPLGFHGVSWFSAGFEDPIFTSQSKCSSKNELHYFYRTCHSLNRTTLSGWCSAVDVLASEVVKLCSLLYMLPELLAPPTELKVLLMCESESRCPLFRVSATMYTFLHLAASATCVHSAFRIESVTWRVLHVFILN